MLFTKYYQIQAARRCSCSVARAIIMILYPTFRLHFENGILAIGTTIKKSWDTLSHTK